MDLQMRMRFNQPCAACRLLRRKCSASCLLAPYFPTVESDNFARVHKVFGASNITKMLQVLDESKREDAVKSMVYEAKARLHDPVYGCAGIIFCLQKHVANLQMQLQSTKAQLLESQAQTDQLQLLAHVNQFNPFTNITPINDFIFDQNNELVLDDHDQNTMGCNPCEYSTDFLGSQEIMGFDERDPGQPSCSALW